MIRPLVCAAIASLCLVANVLAAPTTAPATAPTTAPGAKGQTILLVDDHHVLYRSGTERVVRPAKRHSNQAVIPNDKPWELMIAWNSVYRDAKTGKYQLWYQAYAGTKAGVEKPLVNVVAYAESDDGITFRKPELDFFPFKEHKKTNIILIGNGLGDGAGERYCCSVLVDEREQDPARRYKMAYYDWSMVKGRPEAGLHLAFSPDGIKWTKHEKGPLWPTSFGRYAQPAFADEDILLETPHKDPAKPPRRTWRYSMTMSDAADLFYDTTRQAYVMYGKMWIDSPNGSGQWKHAMGRSESKDFFNWSKGQLLLTPDDRDPTDVDFHTTPVFLYKGVYFCLNQILDRKNKGVIDIELATSRDGFTFERNYRAERFLPHNPSDDTFDGRAIFSNSTPVYLDDEIRFYYGAYNESPIGGGYEETRPKNGVGLATIPLDRFGGIRPVAKSEQTTLRKPLENIGQVTLKPLDLAGVKDITINADASKGAVRVEMLNEKGYRVRGFSKDDATPLKGDGLRQKVAWKGKKLSDLPAGNYQLRVHLDNATLYAIDFK
jgi:hypothetical protein